MVNLKLNEEHKYKHLNTSLGPGHDGRGIRVEGKAHYEYLMKKGGFIPYEEAEKIAEGWDKRNPRKEYRLSTKSRDIIKSLKMTKDKKGNIKLEGRAMKALMETGAIPSPAQQQNILTRLKEGNLI